MGHKSSEDELEHGDDLDNVELDNVEQEDSIEVDNIEQEDDIEVKRQFLNHPYFNTMFERDIAKSDEAVTVNESAQTADIQEKEEVQESADNGEE